VSCPRILKQRQGTKHTRWPISSGQAFPCLTALSFCPSAFEEDELRDEAWTQVQANLARLRGRDSRMTFAVRSSALAEDSAHASFAGAFETVLGVCNDDEVHTALVTVRQSRRSDRAEA